MRVNINSNYKYYSNYEEYDKYIRDNNKSSQGSIKLYFRKDQDDDITIFSATGICNNNEYNNALESIKWDNEAYIPGDSITAESLRRPASGERILLINIKDTTKLSFDGGLDNDNQEKATYKEVNFISISSLTGPLFNNININELTVYSSNSIGSSTQYIEAPSLFNNCNIDKLIIRGNLSINAPVVIGGQVKEYYDERNTNIAKTNDGSFRNITGSITISVKDKVLNSILMNHHKSNSRSIINIIDDNLVEINNIFNDSPATTVSNIELYFSSKHDIAINYINSSPGNFTTITFSKESNENDVSNLKINGGLDIRGNLTVGYTANKPSNFNMDFNNCFDMYGDFSELVFNNETPNNKTIKISGHFLSRSSSAMNYNTLIVIKSTTNRVNLDFKDCEYIGRDKANTLSYQIKGFTIEFKIPCYNTDNCEIFYDLGGATANNNQCLVKRDEYTPILVSISGLTTPVKGILNSFNVHTAPDFDPEYSYGEYIALNIKGIPSADYICTGNEPIYRYFKKLIKGKEVNFKKNDERNNVMTRIISDRVSQCEAVYSTVVINRLPESFLVHNYDNGVELKSYQNYSYSSAEIKDWMIAHYGFNTDSYGDLIDGLKPNEKPSLCINKYGAIYKDRIYSDAGYIIYVMFSRVYYPPNNPTIQYLANLDGIKYVKIRIGDNYYLKYPTIKGLFY